MPILELFPKPSRDPDQTQETAGDAATDQANGRVSQPLKLRTGRYGALEEHEIVHLLDSLDDERSKARFRESVYISIIVYLAFAWFLFYGPRVLFHVPQYRDPIAQMKLNDQQLSLNLPRARPAPKIAPKIDRKTMEALQREAEMERQARLAAPTPQPPAQPPEEQAHVTAPPVPQPQLPLPSEPKPSQPSVESPLPAAPRPNIAQNAPSAHDAIQNAMRGAFSGHADYGSMPSREGPLQAGAQILSDIGDWDPSAYMRRLHNDIQRNWDPLIPEEVEAPLLKKGITGIVFWILPDGSISGPANGQPVLETRSGDVALDHAAWNAITSEGKFPPLPKAYHGPMLALRIGFFYNEPLPE